MQSNTSVDKTTTTDATSIVSNLDDSADSGQLAEAITELASEVDELRATVDQQEQTIDELRATVDQQEQTIDELERDLQESRDERAEMRHRIAVNRKQLTGVCEIVEETVSQGTSPTGAGKTTRQGPTVEPQTDIESMTTMPDTVLEDATANVRRAVFVAKGVDQYTTSCPAGRVIKSGELRRVLAAGTDCQGHTQTVARVIDLLDRTGGDGTTVVERSGERRLVFHDDLVDRLTAIQSQSGDSQLERAV